MDGVERRALWLGVSLQLHMTERSPSPDDKTVDSADDGVNKPARSGQARDDSPPGRKHGPAQPDAPADETSFSYGAEIRRKALHLLALVVPLGMYLLGREDALWILVPASTLAVGADVLRAHSRPFSDHIRRVFGPLMRHEELPPPGEGVVINGATSVLVGATLLTVFFPLSIAVPVIVMTMTADAAAALVGRAVGRHTWPGRSHTVEGTAAFVATGLAVMIPFQLGVVSTLFGVVAAAIAEASPLPLNDNISVPVFAASAVWAAGWLVDATSVSAMGLHALHAVDAWTMGWFVADMQAVSIEAVRLDTTHFEATLPLSITTFCWRFSAVFAASGS